MRHVIAGIYGSLTPEQPRQLAAALDDGTVRTDGSLTVGWTQPAISSTGPFSCVLDGQVEGVARLQDEFGADDPATALAHGYERWQSGLLDRVRGRFTLALWHRETGEGLLAVDQLGTGPLHLYEENGRLYFASEIRDLVRLLARTPEPDPRFLGHYIGGEEWPQDLTPYLGIRRLPGGHAVELSDDSWQLRRYWRPRYAEPLRRSRQEAVNAVHDQLRHTVAKRIDPSRTGILLSGGLDSTSIAGVARKDLGERPRAYSAVFPAHAESDESEILKGITKQLELPWTRVIARRASVIGDSLAYLREWQVPSAVPNLYFILPLLRAAARDGASVVLDGEGGDELFGCVEYAAADRLRRGDAAGAVRLIRQLPWDGEVQPWRATYHLLKRFGAKGVLPYGAHRVSRRVRGGARGGAPWLSEESRRSLADERDPWAWKRADGPLWWAYLADLVTEGRVRLGIPDVLRRLGRMTGVDRRQPYLDDLDLIELVLTLPPELAFDPRHSRPLLREAMVGLLPDSVRLQPSKADFRGLVEECFAGPERAAISALILAPDARIRPFISPAVAEDALAKVGQPRFSAYQAALLRMVTAECWLRSLEDPLFPDRLLETSGLPAADVEVLAA